MFVSVGVAVGWVTTTPFCRETVDILVHLDWSIFLFKKINNSGWQAEQILGSPLAISACTGSWECTPYARKSGLRSLSFTANSVLALIFSVRLSSCVFSCFFGLTITKLDLHFFLLFTHLHFAFIFDIRCALTLFFVGTS